MLKSIIDILNTQAQSNIVDMRDFKEFYKKNQNHAIYSSENLSPNIDKMTGIANNITHSQLIGLLDQKFDELQFKFEPLLREPKISNKLEIYDLGIAESILHPTSSSTSSTSTTSTSSSTPSSSTQASTKTDNDEFYGCVDTLSICTVDISRNDVI